jgi:hypothetical protein
VKKAIKQCTVQLVGFNITISIQLPFITRPRLCLWCITDADKRFQVLGNVMVLPPEKAVCLH